MQTYSMQCSCGHVMCTDASTRTEAVKNLKVAMTQTALDKHLSERHNGQPKPTIEQSHLQIERQVIQGVLS